MLAVKPDLICKPRTGLGVYSVRLRHRVQSYGRDKTDWTVQSRKLSHSGDNSTDIGFQFPLYIDIDRSNYMLWLMAIFERGFCKHLRIYCAFSVFILLRKNHYSPPTKFETRKMSFSLPLSHTTLFRKNFVFFMYRLYQYTHPVSAACPLMPWVINKLSRCKPEPVRVQ